MTPRIEDVARRAGVSIATVSRALRGLANVKPVTRQRVLRAAAELNYTVNPSASRLAAGRTLMVGIVGDAANWFTAQIVAAAQKRFAAAGYDTVFEGPSVQHGASGSPPSHRDGWLFVDVAATDAPVSTPTVAVGLPLPGTPSISVDGTAAADAAIHYLRHHGHRRIALIGCFDHATTTLTLADMHAGYNAAADDYTLEEATTIVASEPTFEAGADAIAELLRRTPPPSAVLAASDNLAAGARWAASAAGVTVPEDLSIIGFGGTNVAVNSDLTTLALPAARMGELAATSMLDAIAGDEVASAVVRAELVTRGSTCTWGTETSSQATGARAGAGTRGDRRARDRDCPAYEWIANDIRTAIRDGEQTAGTQLPSERALARRYGVARETVRKGLTILEREGLIERRRRRGTTVLSLIEGSAT